MTPVEAAEPCDKKLSAAITALEARDLQVQNYRKLTDKQDAYIADLKAQRGEVVELLKPAQRTWLTDEAVFLLGLLAGAGAAFGLSRM